MDEKIKITIERTKTNKSKVNREKNLYGAIYEYENLNTEKEIMETVVRNIDELKSTISLISILVEFNLSKVQW